MTKIAHLREGVFDLGLLKRPTANLLTFRILIVYGPVHIVLFDLASSMRL